MKDQKITFGPWILKKNTVKIENKLFILSAAVFLIYLPTIFLFYKFAMPNSSGRPFPVLYGDSADYLALADNIIKFQSFTLDGQRPVDHITPGYPLFLALILSIFKSYYAVSFIQILLVAITSFLIFKIGEKIISSTAGFVAAFLYIINPSTLYYSMVIMSDVLFSFLLVLSVYLMFFANSKRDRAGIFIAGLLLGFAVLVRPIGMFLPLLFATFYFFSNKKIIDLKKLAILIFIFITAYGFVLTPWILRNKISSGVWGISSLGSFNLFNHNVPLFLSVKYDKDIKEIRTSLYEETNGLNEQEAKRFEHSKEIQIIALKRIFQDPLGYAVFHLSKIFQFLGGNSSKNFYVDTMEILRHKSSPFPHIALIDLILKKEIRLSWEWLKSQHIFNFEYLIWFVIVMLSFASIVFRKYRWQALLFVSIILYFAVLTGPVAHVRYRFQVEPFMFLSALLGFQSFRERTFLFPRRRAKHPHPSV